MALTAVAVKTTSGRRVSERPKSCAKWRTVLLDLRSTNKNENENKKKTLQAVIAIKEKVGLLYNENNLSAITDSQAAYLKP